MRQSKPAVNRRSFMILSFDGRHTPCAILAKQREIPGATEKREFMAL
jgi:hypothetical protein